MSPLRRHELSSARELIEVRLVLVALDALITVLRLEHGTLDDPGEPTGPPTLRAARRVAFHARRLRADLHAYRDAVRRVLARPPFDDLPF
jgi:hypothetical protein